MLKFIKRLVAAYRQSLADLDAQIAAAEAENKRLRKESAELDRIFRRR
jgi:cell division protein FtsB